MKLILSVACIVLTCYTSSAQVTNGTEPKNQTQAQAYSYAYITIEGKTFGKKLKVEVDFGDSPEQVKTGREFSDTLTNKKSYAAVLNYMAANQFELVGSSDNSFSFQGTGGTNGIRFIMRKQLTSQVKE